MLSGSTTDPELSGFWFELERILFLLFFLEVFLYGILYRILVLECQYAYAIYTQVRTHSNTLTYTQVLTYSLLHTNSNLRSCTYCLTQRNTLTYSNLRSCTYCTNTT